MGRAYSGIYRKQELNAKSVFFYKQNNFKCGLVLEAYCNRSSPASFAFYGQLAAGVLFNAFPDVFQSDMRALTALYLYAVHVKANAAASCIISPNSHIFPLCGTLSIVENNATPSMIKETTIIIMPTVL